MLFFIIVRRMAIAHTSREARLGFLKLNGVGTAVDLPFVNQTSRYHSHWLCLTVSYLVWPNINMLEFRLQAEMDQVWHWMTSSHKHWNLRKNESKLHGIDSVTAGFLPDISMWDHFTAVFGSWIVVSRSVCPTSSEWSLACNHFLSTRKLVDVARLSKIHLNFYVFQSFRRSKFWMLKNCWILHDQFHPASTSVH